jgi:hypothetical protein
MPTLLRNSVGRTPPALTITASLRNSIGVPCKSTTTESLAICCTFDPNNAAIRQRDLGRLQFGNTGRRLQRTVAAAHDEHTLALILLGLQQPVNDLRQLLARHTQFPRCPAPADCPQHTGCAIRLLAGLDGKRAWKQSPDCMHPKPRISSRPPTRCHWRNCAISPAARCATCHRQVASLAAPSAPTALVASNSTCSRTARYST